MSAPHPGRGGKGGDCHKSATFVRAGAHQIDSSPNISVCARSDTGNVAFVQPARAGAGEILAGRVRGTRPCAGTACLLDFGMQVWEYFRVAFGIGAWKKKNADDPSVRPRRTPSARASDPPRFPMSRTLRRPTGDDRTSGAAPVDAAGVPARIVSGRNTTHGKINDDLGTPGDAVSADLFAFVDKALGR